MPDDALVTRAADKEDRRRPDRWEYREKQYRVMLGIDSLWKWSVDGIEG
jgi:hypothetical protein